MILLALITSQIFGGYAYQNCDCNWYFRWTNAPSCVVLEGSVDLTNWEELSTHSNRRTNWQSFEYPVDTNGPTTFYRLRTCQ